MVRQVLICAPADRSGSATVPGTIEATATCGHQVVLAPSGQRLVSDGTVTEIRCIGCAISLIPTAEVLMTPPGALEEVESFAGEARRAWAELWLGNMGVTFQG